MKKVFQLLIAIAFGLILDSCFNEKYPVVDLATPPATKTVSFAIDIQPILNNNCIACHFTGSGLPDFTADNSFAAMTDLINSGNIIPGNADGSELMEMLNGVQNVMPPSGPMLKSFRDLIGQWINQGAKNN